MKHILARFLFFLSLLFVVGCSITKRKYTGGFYVEWNKKVSEAMRPHPTLSYEERGKSRPPQRTCEVATREQVKDKLSIPRSTASRVQGVQVQQKEIPKNISTSSSSPAGIAGGLMHVESVKARNRDNGLTGFEIGVLNIIATALLIFFGRIGYGIFVIGMFLIVLFLFISGLIYSFMGLNRNDKHRGLALLGILIEAAVLYALIKFA